MSITAPTPSSVTTTGAPLIARDLVASYGPVVALGGVSLTIPAGQSVAVMGPSGSGKSTLLHCLSGVIVPDSGEVNLGETRVSHLPDRQRSRLRRDRFGFVFQDELTARENVALPLLLQSVARGKALAEADTWLARLGLTGLERRRPGDMSGGQAQRVAVARALIHRPSVVFADEPTGALDQATGHEVMQILAATAGSAGTTLVVVTHDAAVARWCNRVVEIRDALIHSDTDQAVN